MKYTKINKFFLVSILALFLIGGLVCASAIKSKINSSSAKVSSKFTQFTLLKPPYRLVISGYIPKDRSRVKIDFIYLNPAIGEIKPPSSKTQFKILLKKNGRVIYEDILPVAECIVEDDYCLKADFSYGYFFYASDKFWELPDEIVFQYQGKNFFSLKKPKAPFPRITLIEQKYEKDVIELKLKVEGKNKNIRYFARVFRNGEEFSTFLLENTLNEDGSPIFVGNSFRYKPNFGGNIQIVIYATDGFRTYVGYSKTFKLPSKPPQIGIISPKNGEIFEDYVLLEGFVIDPFTGLVCSNEKCLGDAVIKWISNIDGVISNKLNAYCQFLTPGDHIITLNVKSKDGTETSTSVKIKVKPGNKIFGGERGQYPLKSDFCY